MKPDPPLVPDFTMLIRQEQRRWTLIGVLAFLLLLSLGLNTYQAIEVRTAVDSLEATADDTNRAVELLESRTPLFSELQATANRADGRSARNECIALLEAAVLDALAETVALEATGAQPAVERAAARVAATRVQLSRLGTEDDPCPEEDP